MHQDHNNLQDCVDVKSLTPLELAGALRTLAAKINKPLGVGIWEGTLEGKVGGTRRDGEHVAVFQEQSLVAPFGPRGDEESEASAVLFVTAVKYAETIARALELASRTEKEPPKNL
jgi:hypothetical protein